MQCGRARPRQTGMIQDWLSYAFHSLAQLFAYPWGTESCRLQGSVSGLCTHIQDPDRLLWKSGKFGKAFQNRNARFHPPELERFTPESCVIMPEECIFLVSSFPRLIEIRLEGQGVFPQLVIIKQKECRQLEGSV